MMFVGRKLVYIILCCLGIIMFGGITGVSAVVRNYKFQVTSSSYTRLCTRKTMLTVNGQSPGPTVYARRGDLVIIDVINTSDQNITIHWHGVKMPRNPWSDGTGYVTQCPITPGTRFRQRMILSNEEGTLWWHAHIDWSRNSVYGAIVILPPKTRTYPFPKPHAQVQILLGEWWNDNVEQVYEEFLASGINPEISNAFLINGQPGDMYPCSTQDTYKLRVKSGKTYMIRLVNAVMSNIMFFKIANHNLTVIGTDGAYTKPLQTDYVAISPGQTIDLLVEANQPPSHYYMGARALGREVIAVTTPTTGILEYEGNYTPPSSPLLPCLPESNNSAMSVDFTSKLRSLGNDVKVPKNITKHLFYTLAINLWPCRDALCAGSERLLASINNVTMLLPRNSIDILDAYYRGINGVYSTDFPDFPALVFNYTEDKFQINESRPQFGTAVSILEYNTTVELVFQNTIFGSPVGHSVHLHGYSFYVVGSRLGDFDSIKDPPNYNLVDPPLMETIAVPVGGWTAIRFTANNPGVWYMHCHYERHQSWGMKMAFIVKDGKGPNEKMLPPPADMPRCRKQLPSINPFLLYDKGKTNNLVKEKVVVERVES